MFGEGLMFGTFDRTVDNKGRILLPRVCCTSKSDVLVLLAQEHFIEVWSKEDFMKLIQRLGNENDIYLDEITAFIFNMIGVSTIKGDYRLTLGEKLVSMYQLQDGVVIEGKGRCIRIWNKFEFLSYKDKLNCIDLLTLQKEKK